MKSLRSSVKIGLSILACLVTQPTFTDAFQNTLVGRQRTSAPHKDDEKFFLQSAAFTFERTQQSSTTALGYSRNDNLFSGLAEIGIGFAVGVMWSEYNIIQTGCGPLNFSDTLERICYQGVIVLMAVALFNRIVARQSLEKTVGDFFGPLLDSTLIQIRLAEIATAIAVVGAFIALGVQYQSGANMDGMSGIDISFCKAIRDSRDI